jgi:hypothetical protein
LEVDGLKTVGGDTIELLSNRSPVRVEVLCHQLYGVLI